MIGLIILAVVFFWMLLGKGVQLTYKLILVAFVIFSYIYYLHSQGANAEQILEILFTFK